MVELLVVIIVIALLAAIAVPIYLDQRRRSHDSVALEDLRNLRVTMTSAVTEHPDATAVWLEAPDAGGRYRVRVDLPGAGSTEVDAFQASPGVTVDARLTLSGASTPDSVCLAASVEAGKVRYFSTDLSGAVTSHDLAQSCAG